MDLLRAIRHLLYGEGYTIRGVQRLLKERGLKMVVAMGAGGVVSPAPVAAAVAPQAPLARESISLAADLDEPQDDLAPEILMAPDELRASASQPVPVMHQAQPEAAPAADVEPLLRALLADISEAQRLLRAARMS
jgi:hypothetical protein